MKKYTTLLALAAMTSAASAAGILIDENTGNGGFTHATNNFNATNEISGWTATTGIWVQNSSSGLTGAPAGAEVLANTWSIQIHADAGETLTSDAVSLIAGETINFSLDYRAAGGGAETTLTIDLWDGVNSIALGTLDTAGGPAAWTQADFNGATVGVTGNYQLRMVLPSAGGVGRDIHVDRVYLETTAVPEPSSAALLGLGGLALILRRRK